MLEFYWSLGADISRMYPGKKRNLNFFENLSSDLCLGIDNPKGLSVANIRYAFRFYELYSRIPQVSERNAYLQQVVADNVTGGCSGQATEERMGCADGRTCPLPRREHSLREFRPQTEESFAHASASIVGILCFHVNSIAYNLRKSSIK